MHKSILMSIHPEPCEHIFGGIKKREIRKVLPRIEFPCKVYVYQTKPSKYKFFDMMTNPRKQGTFAHKLMCNNSKVIGEFICTGYDRLVHCGTTNHDATLQLVDDNYNNQPITKEFLNLCCLSYKQLEDYSKGGDLYALHITDAKLYKQPKELSEFTICCKEYDKDNPNCECCDYQSTTYDYDTPPQFDCKCNGLKSLTRPPQSFCYVEEA